MNTTREQRVSRVAQRVCSEQSVIDIAVRIVVEATQNGRSIEDASARAVAAVTTEAIRQAEAAVA